MPLHLFSNRTSATGFALTFFHTLSGIPALYFLPVYFQAILNSTPARAGVQLLPTVLGILPGAIVSGLVLTKFGRYKPIQFVGFAFMTIGFGVLLLLKVDPRPDQWIGYQLISAIGTGLVLPVGINHVMGRNDANCVCCRFYFQLYKHLLLKATSLYQQARGHSLEVSE